MRYLLLIFAISVSFSLFGQRSTRFIFVDACSDEVTGLEFELTHFYINPESDKVQDSIQNIKSGELITLNKNLYFITANIKGNNWISTFYFDIYPDQTSESDTLYLNKLRSNWNGLLHPQIVKHFYCDQIADGEVIERDINGTIRGTGTFEDGIPKSHIKFFDGNGNITKKEIYRNGYYVRTKKYKK